MKKIILALILMFSTSASADNLGSSKGGQAAPQSGLSGGLCYTSPIVLTNGQQASLAIDCTTHALIVTLNGGGSSVIRSIQTGASDFATVDDFSLVAGHAIFWNSATASAKIEHLPVCDSGLSGAIGTIVDEIGTAATYSITLTPIGSDTINLSPSYPLIFNQQSVTIQCNGAGNWVLQ